MGEFPRKSDGRRVFTVEFKRGVVQQLLKGEKTLAEVSRELDIQPSVVRQWKRRFEAGATAAVATNEDVVPVSALREAHQRIRELERLLGKSGHLRCPEGDGPRRRPLPFRGEHETSNHSATSRPGRGYSRLRLPRDLAGTELAALLRRYGYEQIRQTGGHMRLTSSLKARNTTSRFHATTRFGVGTVSSILADVASYLEISRAELVNTLFG
jgi:transposase-like protein/predicted RNA binding protein YcfA (HicA-like mRNA interferase family)